MDAICKAGHIFKEKSSWPKDPQHCDEPARGYVSELVPKSTWHFLPIEPRFRIRRARRPSRDKINPTLGAFLHRFSYSLFSEFTDGARRTAPGKFKQITTGTDGSLSFARWCGNPIAQTQVQILRTREEADKPHRRATPPQRPGLSPRPPGLGEQRSNLAYTLSTTAYEAYPLGNPCSAANSGSAAPTFPMGWTRPRTGVSWECPRWPVRAQLQKEIPNRVSVTKRSLAATPCCGVFVVPAGRYLPIDAGPASR